jgi:threonine aldolase
MRLHMDGARAANAAVSLGLPLRAFTRDAGVDVLSFGGTKNGLLFGECIVVLNSESSEGLHYLRKLTMQLASKMRFLSAQFLALFGDDLWLRNASHANAMAARLRGALESAIAAGNITDVSFTQPTQTNAVFAVLPVAVAVRVRKEFSFYDWNGSAGEVRWMCSYDTTETDVDRFVACLIRATAAQRDLADRR